MNNLEKILKAYAMNYAAVIFDPDDGLKYKLLFITPKDDLFFVDEEGDRWIAGGEDVKDCEIIEWLYMGQLGGNEPIPEGQKFKIKKTGEIAEANPYSMSESFISLKAKRGDWAYTKNEIEPYFD